MKRLGAILCVVGLVVGTSPSQAQTTIATTIGTKLITSVISALIGKGMDSIFGTDDTSVTATELASALDKSFNSEKLKDIEADVISLRTKVRSYQKTASIDSRRSQIDDITNLADSIRSTIQVRIHSDGDFFSLLPDYMKATNVWLAFKAERKFVSVETSASSSERATAYAEANEIVVAEAVQALTTLKDFYYQDFVDTGTRRCFIKKTTQHLYNLKGSDIGNTIRALKDGPKEDVSTLFCYTSVLKYFAKHGAVYDPGSIELYYKPHTNFYKNYYTFKHPKKNEWFFTYETSIGRDKDGEYVLAGPYTSEAAAEKARVALAILFYSDIVGNIPEIARTWESLVVKIGDADQKTEAKALLEALGA